MCVRSGAPPLRRLRTSAVEDFERLAQLGHVVEWVGLLGAQVPVVVGGLERVAPVRDCTGGGLHPVGDGRLQARHDTDFGGGLGDYLGGVGGGGDALQHAQGVEGVHDCAREHPGDAATREAEDHSLRELERGERSGRLLQAHLEPPLGVERDYVRVGHVNLLALQRRRIGGSNRSIKGSRRRGNGSWPRHIALRRCRRRGSCSGRGGSCVARLRLQRLLCRGQRQGVPARQRAMHRCRECAWQRAAAVVAAAAAAAAARWSPSGAIAAASERLLSQTHPRRIRARMRRG